MRSSSSPRRTPSRSRALYASSRGIFPAITPEPIMAGWKRAPSSLVKMAMATGCRVRIFPSLRVRIVSSAQRTPSWPSYLPPVGTESACEPIMTGAKPSSPARWPKMLPIRSTVTVRPASRIHLTRRSRPRRSSSVRATRLSPPRAVAPMRPRASMLSSSRFRSMRIDPPGSEPQIGFLEPLVGGEVARGTRQDETPIFQHAGAVGKGQRTADVLLHEENGHARAIDGCHRFEDPLHEHGSDAEGGLVQHEESRPRHEGAADGAHLLLAARERAGELARPLAQDGEEIEHVGEALGELGPRRRGMRAQEQVLAHRHEGEESPPLRHLHNAAAHAIVRRDAREVLAGEGDLAGPRGEGAGDHPESSGLARGVGADQGQDFPLLHVEADAVERLQIAVEGVDALKRQQARTPLRGRRRSPGDPRRWTAASLRRSSLRGGGPRCAGPIASWPP